MRSHCKQAHTSQSVPVVDLLRTGDLTVTPAETVNGQRTLNPQEPIFSLRHCTAVSCRTHSWNHPILRDLGTQAAFPADPQQCGMLPIRTQGPL